MSANAGQTSPELNDSRLNSLQKVFELLALTAGPLAASLGLLYYLGWLRTAAIFQYFGLDHRLLGLTRDEYLLRGVGSAFLPAIVVVILVVTYIVLSRTMVWLGQPNRQGLLTVVSAACAFLGSCLLLMALLAAFGWQIANWPYLGPFGLIFSAGLLELAFETTGNSDRRLQRRVVLMCASVIGCFWGVSVYAQSVGTERAAEWNRRPELLAKVTIVSDKELSILAEDGLRADFDSTATSYAYRYSGFRLLAYGNDRWFLLSENSVDSVGSAFVIRDDLALRIETQPGG